VYSDFPSLFKSLIDADFKSVRAFARIIPGTDEDTQASWISKVIRGRASAPPDYVEAWADALKLEGHRKQLFLDFAAVTHLLPPSIRPRFYAILKRIETINALGLSLQEDTLANNDLALSNQKRLKDRELRVKGVRKR
jgi:hypothetical protein